MQDIKSYTVEMRDGNFVKFFVNTATNLVVVDYIHKNERGGNEIARRTLDPATMLAHCETKRRRKQTKEIGF